MYAEIILPLPLQSTFTYSVPEELKDLLQTGTRVLVQFGRKKYYTGIVSHLHNDRPDYEVKEIAAVMDRKPVVRYPQLKLWRWIAEYYLCSEGDVMKAALPTGLKPESETFVTLNDDFEIPEGFTISDHQAVIMSLLQHKGRMRISDIQNELKIRNVTKLIGSLIEAEILTVAEQVVERYRARKETFVTLGAERGDQTRLHEFFDMVGRSQRQERLLVTYLDKSGWLHPANALRDVTKAELMELPEISPSIFKAMQDKGIFKIEKRTVNRFNPESETHEPELAPLTDIQREAHGAILEQFRENKPVLLHGITGSGKTEIYTHLIAAALRDGNQALYLVPEISLTTQLTDRLRKVFGDRLLVYHSKFSDNERVDIWKRLLDSSEPLVILGVRSSVFLPFSRLGLVVIDEEHESSYKQSDPAPRYNARDTAMVLASMHGAHVLMGSATPAIDTYYKAKNGKFGLVTLTERYEGSVLPDVEIVDMPRQRKEKQVRGILSTPLLDRIRRAMASGRQAILFQNRRGFAPMVVCRQCGWVPKCDNCDVSLVYHKNTGMLRCHYCGYSRVLPALCPVCGQNSIETFGYGTERIAEDVQEAFPDARISRMDLDTTRNKDSYQQIIESFSNHETDILVGTQMISKGLDFEKVNVVGVASADTLLNFPDFRSDERAFNMLEQVAGRAGRRQEKGTVVIQTSKPDNEVLGHVVRHDYTGFYSQEIEHRRQFNYPPFTKVINIYLKNKDARALDRASATYAAELRAVFGNRVLGPQKPFVSRVALWYIQGLMLKVESQASMKKVKELLHGIFERTAKSPDMKSTVIYYDIDPA
ncbi:MAG: primosomal protein N' [Bacteroidales bacterium]|nr:primosomal protein N' [Bacteroidales bacterium]